MPSSPALVREKAAADAAALAWDNEKTLATSRASVAAAAGKADQQQAYLMQADRAQRLGDMERTHSADVTTEINR